MRKMRTDLTFTVFLKSVRSVLFRQKDILEISKKTIVSVGSTIELQKKRMFKNAVQGFWYPKYIRKQKNKNLSQNIKYEKR